MQATISVQHDLHKLRRSLNGFQRNALPMATARTLNRLADSSKSASSRYIAPQIGGRQAAVKRRIITHKSTVRRLWAVLEANEKPIRLIEFVVGSKKPTQQKGGKRGLVKVKAWGKTRTYHGAFIAPRKRGSADTEIYLRKSKKRLPLKMMFGPGIMQLFKQNENVKVMEENIRSRIGKEFVNNLNFYSSKARF